MGDISTAILPSKETLDLKAVSAIASALSVLLIGREGLSTGETGVLDSFSISRLGRGAATAGLGGMMMVLPLDGNGNGNNEGEGTVSQLDGNGSEVGVNGRGLSLGGNGTETEGEDIGTNDKGTESEGNTVFDPILSIGDNGSEE